MRAFVMILMVVVLLLAECGRLRGVQKLSPRSLQCYATPCEEQRLATGIANPALRLTD
jgi:hypothetical protein